MIGRLGLVLYWTGSGVALLLLAIGAAMALFGVVVDKWFIAGMFSAAALASFLVGRAARFILKGD